MEVEAGLWNALYQLQRTEQDAEEPLGGGASPSTASNRQVIKQDKTGLGPSVQDPSQRPLPWKETVELAAKFPQHRLSGTL